MTENSANPGLIPPPVVSVPAGVHRPLWSVMIPTFNCAKLLHQTLQSVLAQDPGADQMQIEVVDDCSTKDDPEVVVHEVGKGRVSFFRKSANSGAIPNFNTCIERSRGHLVHILHGDDWVEEGLYSSFAQAFGLIPPPAAVFCRAFIVDEAGELELLSDRVTCLESGGCDPGDLLTVNSLRTPAVVVRRSFYEANGGFIPRLVHVADWEMWVRAIALGGAKMLNRPLANYRMFDSNDTGRLARTGENLRDYLRLAAVWEQSGLPGFKAALFREQVARSALKQSKKFKAKGDLEAAHANYQVWQELYPQTSRWIDSLRAGVRRIRRGLALH